MFSKKKGGSFNWKILPLCCIYYLIADISDYWFINPITEKNLLDKSLITDILLTVIIAPKGAKYKVSLPVSSEFWLNIGSKIICDKSFKVRIVFAKNEFQKYKFSSAIENETRKQIMQTLKLTAPQLYCLLTKTSIEIQKAINIYTINPNIKLYITN